MANTDAESSLTINRITMEDNIFDKRPTREYRTASVNQLHYSPLEPFKESRLTHISTIVVLTAVVVQVILGLFANSLALISDACRQFSDHLEQHRYDHSATPGNRLKEIILMAIPCVFTAVLGVIFLVNASTRAANPVFEINVTFLIIGTIIAATINSLQLFVHVQTWKSHRSYSLSQYAENHRSQCLHGFVNHGLAVTIIVVTALIAINENLKIWDSIGTYIITSLVFTNIAAAGLYCYREYCDLDSRSDYEPL